MEICTFVVLSSLQQYLLSWQENSAEHLLNPILVQECSSVKGVPLCLGLCSSYSRAHGVVRILSSGERVASVQQGDM